MKRMLAMGLTALMISAPTARAEPGAPAPRAVAPELAAQADPAARAPLFTRIRYETYYSGFHIADVDFTLDTRPDSYRADMHIEPRGLMAWFVGEFSADIVSRGDYRPGGVTLPRTFERKWTADHGYGTVVIDYDPESRLATGRYVEYKSDHKHAEKNTPDTVPPEQRVGVVDPLAVLVAMRHKLLSGQRNDLTFKVFDGKRRFDLTGDVAAPRRYDILNSVHSVIPMNLDIAPLAGFSERQAKGWATAEFKVKFSDDGRAVPLQIMLDTKLGGLVLNLIDTCQATAGQCALPPVQEARAD